MPENNIRKQPKSKLERASLREKICRSLDLYPDALGNAAVIEIRGQNRVNIQGKLRMLSYSPTEIRLLTKNGELNIIGNRLFCSAYSKESLIIDGKISSVSFKEDI